MEQNIPPPPFVLYKAYQQSFWKFIGQYHKLGSQYQESLTGFQLEWLKRWEIILNPSLPKEKKLNTGGFRTAHTQFSKAKKQEKMQYLQKNSVDQGKISKTKSRQNFLRSIWPLLP